MLMFIYIRILDNVKSRLQREALFLAARRRIVETFATSHRKTFCTPFPWCINRWSFVATGAPSALTHVRTRPIRKRLTGKHIKKLYFWQTHALISIDDILQGYYTSNKMIQPRYHKSLQHRIEEKPKEQKTTLSVAGILDTHSFVFCLQLFRHMTLPPTQTVSDLRCAVCKRSVPKVVTRVLTWERCN